MNSEMNSREKNLCTIISPCGNFGRSAEALGIGASKIVFYGRDLNQNLPVAWCQPKCNNKDERKNLKKESEILRQLNHPNIINVFAFWDIEHEERKNSTALITELMDQGSLDIYRGKFKEVKIDVYTRWSYDILLGLEYLHSLNPPVIHCDIKCANILVSGPPERLKIADFGIATTEVNRDASTISGTPNFMAPEAWKSKYSQASDVYAFGMCLAEMVTGRIPYEECLRICDIKKKIDCGSKPKNFAEIREGITLFLIEWCTDVDPIERPTCSELLQSYFHRRVQQILDQHTCSDASVAPGIQVQTGDHPDRADINVDASDEPSTSSASNKMKSKFVQSCRIARPSRLVPPPLPQMCPISEFNIKNGEEAQIEWAGEAGVASIAGEVGEAGEAGEAGGAGEASVPQEAGVAQHAQEAEEPKESVGILNPPMQTSL